MSPSVRNVVLLLAVLLLQSCSSSPSSSTKPSKLNWSDVDSFITSQRKAGHPNYDPEWLYLVDPAKQRMKVISIKTHKTHQTLRCGTGKRGLGTKHAQTPPGFFTMGGVRIANNANTAIQTGDSKKASAEFTPRFFSPPLIPTPNSEAMCPMALSSIPTIQRPVVCSNNVGPSE